MARLVTGYQPHYFPRLHYLARAQQADVFVVYDDVEFSRKSRHHRAPIDHFDDDWLTIPIRHDGTDVRIDEALIDMSTPWPVDHLNILREKYGPTADEWRPFFGRLCVNLVDLESLKERRDDVVRSLDSELVDECIRLDDELQSRRREYRLSALQERKNRLATRIGERKRANPNADLDALIDRATTLTEELTTAKEACRRLRVQRNRALVALSRSLDDADLERHPMVHLWSLEGIAPRKLLDDVRLVEVTVPILLELFRRFDIESTVVRSSELAVEHPGDPSEYLAQLTDYLEGDQFLSGGTGYERYLDEAPFHERGQQVLVQDWSPTWDGGNVCSLDVLYSTETPAVYVNC